MVLNAVKKNMLFRYTLDNDIYLCVRVYKDIGDSNNVSVLLKDIINKSNKQYDIRLDVSGDHDIEDYSLKYLMDYDKIHDVDLI